MILIPAKGQSTRCPHKNEILLPYMAQYLVNEGMLKDAVVLTDSENIKCIAKSLGFNVWNEHRHRGDDDLSVCQKFMQQCNDSTFYMLPLTQPFKHKGLLEDMYNALDANTDFVVTSHTTTDRAIFYVKEGRFMYPSYGRKGCLCPEREMVDGTAYLIRKEYMQEAWTNAEFWSGRFATVVNKAPWLDIDTPEDLEKFKFICEYAPLTRF